MTALLLLITLRVLDEREPRQLRDQPTNLGHEPGSGVVSHQS
jgi:hypothetical protein